MVLGKICVFIAILEEKKMHGNWTGWLVLYNPIITQGLGSDQQFKVILSYIIPS